MGMIEGYFKDALGGDVDNTLFPVPVFVTDIMFFDPFSARAVEAVRPDRVVVLAIVAVPVVEIFPSIETVFPPNI